VAWTLGDQVAQGRALAPQFEAELGGLHDGPPQRLVAAMGARLLEALRALESESAAVLGAAPRWTAHPFRFGVLNSEIVNAFALPDGSIYVTRGLLDVLPGEDQVAAVLAHEIGHVVLRHTARAFERQAKGDILLWVLGSVVRDDLAGDLAGAANVLFQLSFSRDQESEADAFGFVLACVGGFDPAGLSQVFEVFRRLDQDATPEFLRTHPLAERRGGQLQGLSCRFPVPDLR
jgi:predicted Zn-dependent protease